MTELGKAMTNPDAQIIPLADKLIAKVFEEGCPAAATLKPGQVLGIEPSIDRDLAERQLPPTFQDELRELRIRAGHSASAPVQGEPVAWGRVIDGKAVTVSLDWTVANDEPLYAAPSSERHASAPATTPGGYRDAWLEMIKLCSKLKKENFHLRQAIGTPDDAREALDWLIEWPEDDNVPVRWWNPNTGWMRDASKAMRFCRECDAADYIAGTGHWTSNIKPTEHKFGLAAGPHDQEDVGKETSLQKMQITSSDGGVAPGTSDASPQQQEGKS